MDVDSLRAFCLSFPNATEKLQWGEELCFKAGKKIFAMINLGSVPPAVIFKCTPESFAELTEREGIAPSPYVGRYKWVRVSSLEVLPDFELRNLVRQSYEMVSVKSGAKGKKTPRAARPRTSTSRSRKSRTS